MMPKNKLPKIESALDKKVKEIKEREEVGLNNEKIFEEYVKNYRERSIMTNREKQLFSKLKKIIKENGPKNKYRFRLDYLFELELP